jgi:hypothetical protein
MNQSRDAYNGFRIRISVKSKIASRGTRRSGRHGLYDEDAIRLLIDPDH